MYAHRKAAVRAVPLLASLGLLLAACGGGPEARPQAATQQPPVAPDAGSDAAAAEPAADPATEAEAEAEAAGARQAPERRPAATGAAAAGAAAGRPAPGGAAKAQAPVAEDDVAGRARALTRPPAAKPAAGLRAADDAKNRRIYEEKAGATDVGVTRDEIRLGSVNMHGMALGNILVAPQARANLATLTSINDRGGVLGRRLAITDCDDGPGDVSRSKSCIKKLVGQDRIFALVTGIDWATASIHDDLKTFELPYVGTWAYSQTEWQDPYMFPAHTSMIHEAIAGARWVRDTIRPKTYGLLCLTSPEMQLACNQVQRVLGEAGVELVKKVDVGISETSMSAQILALRTADPDHVVHYVINAATMAKFMLEAQQQNYYPPMGISGNHLAAEVLGSIFGRYPAGRYWTNTTYKLWGAEFAAVMARYARGNKGLNHHIIQAGYTGINIFARAARQVGPNLTRERLMTQLGNGTVWESDAALDQRFQYIPSERSGDDWSRENAQGREFMYKYVSANTVGNPDGSPSGFLPAENWVIHTH